MANMQKYTRGNMRGLSIHWDRKTENHANEDIDTDRTDLNYDLCEREGDTLSRLQERLKEVYCMDRKDVNVCVSWVVTLPKELKNIDFESQKEFFETTYTFLADRYGGEKNVLSANVHNDETTPHMHYVFAPVVWDEKKQREKVSAKLVMQRRDLRTFHQDLDKHLKERLSFYEHGILNDKTIGIDDVPSLKKHSEEIKKQENMLDQKREKLKVEQELVKNKRDGLKKYNSKLNNVYDTNLKWDDLENRFERTITGKRVVKKEHLNDLKEFVMGVKRVAAEDNRKYSNEKMRNDSLSSELKDMVKAYERVARRFNNQKGELADLVKSHKKLKEKVIVLESLLKDTGRIDLNISNEEYKGRLILNDLEVGYMPNNTHTCAEWHNTLLENMEKGNIPKSRIGDFIDKLKEWYQDLKNREIRKSKSRDMEI